MTFTGFLLIAAVLALETVEQLFFRMAGTHRRYYFHFAIPGVLTHLLGLAIWFLTLKVLPLSYALPFMGAAYVTIALSSRWLFDEKISRRGWLGILLVTIGVVIVGGVEL